MNFSHVNFREDGSGDEGAGGYSGPGVSAVAVAAALSGEDGEQPDDAEEVQGDAAELDDDERESLALRDAVVEDFDGTANKYTISRYLFNECALV